MNGGSLARGFEWLIPPKCKWWHHIHIDGTTVVMRFGHRLSNCAAVVTLFRWHPGRAREPVRCPGVSSPRVVWGTGVKGGCLVLIPPAQSCAHEGCTTGTTQLVTFHHLVGTSIKSVEKLESVEHRHTTGIPCAVLISANGGFAVQCILFLSHEQLQTPGLGANKMLQPGVLWNDEIRAWPPFPKLWQYV